MREMKDSGVEWIGEIPVDWKLSKIKHHFKISSGTTPKSDNSELWDGEIIWVTPADFKTDDVYVKEGHRNLSQKGYDESSLEIVPAGNIIFSKRAPIGQVVINKVDLCTNQGCLSAVPTDLSCVRYYRYLMCIATEKFEIEGSGTTFKEISATSFGNVQFPLPSYSEQIELANYLDGRCSKIDAIIEREQTVIEKLKEYKLSVITEAVTKGLNPDAEMKDSGIEWIGKMPSDWKTVKLKYCTYIRARLGWKGLKADEYVEDGFPLLSAFNIVNDKLVFENMNFINEDRYEESPEIKLCINDVLLVKDGAGIGKCAIVTELPFYSTVNGSIAVVTASNNLSGGFLYYYFSSNMFQKFIDRVKAGMGVPHLFQSDLKEIQIPLPNENEQESIIDYLTVKCNNIDDYIYLKQSVIDKLTEYKKSLIYEVVTGKKEV